MTKQEKQVRNKQITEWFKNKYDKKIFDKYTNSYKTCNTIKFQLSGITILEFDKFGLETFMKENQITYSKIELQEIDLHWIQNQEHQIKFEILPDCQVTIKFDN